MVKMKKEGASRSEFLLQAVKIEGIYVPSFYDVSVTMMMEQ